MIGSSSTSLEVKVDGKVDPYEAAMARATRATQNYERSIESVNRDIMALEKQIDDDVAKRLQEQHAAYEKVGRGMVIAGGAMLIGAGLAAKAAIDWESAWTGVEKTVDGSAEQMDVLEQQLRDLATVLPSSHEEIAAVAEAAGQLGVQRENIASFTRTMIDLGQTTNLSADEAATSIARFTNIMQTLPQETERVGAALVDLGNKGASTEAEIMSMSLRIAGAGKQVGLSESDVLATANALSSLGVQAEAGGSAVSQIFMEMASAADKGGGALEDYAGAADMTTGEFERLVKTDPGAALAAFTQGLGRMKEEGGSALAVLDTMEITQIRQRDVLLRLAGGGDILTKSLHDGTQAWRENSALAEEAAKRYGTTEAKIQIARNQLEDFTISVGEGLLPILGKGADGVSDFAAGLRGMPGPVKHLIGPITALFGAITLLGGVALLAIPKIAAFNAAVASGNLGPALQTAGSAAQRFGSALMGPMGIGLGIAVAGLAALAMQAGETRNRIVELQGTLDETSGDATVDTLNNIVAALQKKGWTEFGQEAGVSMAEMTNAVLEGGDAMDLVKTKIDNYEDGLGIMGSAWNSATGDSDQFISTLETERENLLKSQEGHEDHKDAVDAATGAQGALKGQTEETSEALVSEADAAQKLEDALTAVNDAILGSRAGARSYQETLDSSRATLMKGVHTLNISTDAGRENQAALDAVAGETVSWAQALTKVDESGRSSFRVMRQGRADLLKMATAFFGSKKEAQAYVNEVLRIPPKWSTKFDTPGLGEARGGARGLAGDVRNIPDRHETTITAATAAAQMALGNFVGAANTLLGGIHDEEVFVTVRRSNVGGFGPQKRAAGGPIYGVGGPTQDNIPVLASVNEHMWTAREVAAAGGHGAVRRLRDSALAGELAGSRAGGAGQMRLAVDLGMVEVSGTLSSDLGPVKIHGIARAAARQEIEADHRFQGALNDRD